MIHTYAQFAELPDSSHRSDLLERAKEFAADAAEHAAALHVAEAVRHLLDVVPQLERIEFTVHESSSDSTKASVEIVALRTTGGLVIDPDDIEDEISYAADYLAGAAELSTEVFEAAPAEAKGEWQLIVDHVQVGFDITQAALLATNARTYDPTADTTLPDSEPADRGPRVVMEILGVTVDVRHPAAGGTLVHLDGDDTDVWDKPVTATYNNAISEVSLV